MADETLVIYYFDGVDGCDICNVLTGYTFDADPRPHVNCDCAIECIDMETQGDCWMELREPLVDVYEDEVESTQWTDGRCIPWEQEYSYELATREINDLSTDLEAAAVEAEWSPPESGYVVVEYTVPAHAAGYMLTTTSRWYYADIEATWYLVCSIDGNLAERALYTEYGSYMSVYDYDATASFFVECEHGPRRSADHP